jgi:hypothetical protein
MASGNTRRPRRVPQHGPTAAFAAQTGGAPANAAQTGGAPAAATKGHGGAGARPTTLPDYIPAAFFTKRPSKVLVRLTLASRSSGSKATSMSLADCMPAAGMTPVSE